MTSEERFGPVLQVGERIAFADGSEWECYRSAVSSAGVRCVRGTPGATVNVGVDFADGRSATFEKARAGAYRVGERLEISQRSAVRRLP